jgi:hypothetical protein
MMGRCYLTSYAEYQRYGLRGIFVCPEWHDFWVFFDWVCETYEPGKTLDRVNNDGPYSPENCRWATPTEQQANARIGRRSDGIKKAQEARRLSGYKDLERRLRNKKGQFGASIR